MIKNNYKIHNYEYFLKNRFDYKKWELERINPYEAEECLIEDLKNLNKYKF